METAKSTIIITLVIIASVFASGFALASPASPAMLDSENCHVCMRTCSKFGLDRNQKHCHIFPPYAFEDYKNTYNPNKARYGEIFRTSMDRISLTADKKSLLVCPIDKAIAGDYEVTSEGCGIGGGTVTLSKGVVPGIKKLFDAVLPANREGLYKLTVDKKDYQSICVCNNRIAVMNKKNDVVCTGNFVKDKLYLFCKGLIDEATGDKTDNYCKATLARTASK